MRHYQQLTLKEKLALLDMVKAEAVKGPLEVFDLLFVLEVFVPESAIRSACLDRGWTEKQFHELWKFSEASSKIVFGL